jgi:hypothetical protein
MRAKKLMIRAGGATEADFLEVDVGFAKPILFIKPALLPSFLTFLPDQLIYNKWFDENRTLSAVTSDGYTSITVNPSTTRILQDLMSYSYTEFLTVQEFAMREYFTEYTYQTAPYPKYGWQLPPFWHQGYTTGGVLGGVDGETAWTAYVNFIREFRGRSVNSNAVVKPSPGNMSMFWNHAHEGTTYKGSTISKSGDHGGTILSKAGLDSRYYLIDARDPIGPTGNWANYEGWVMIEGPTLVGAFEIGIDNHSNEVHVINVVTADQVATHLEAYMVQQPINSASNKVRTHIRTLRDKPTLRFGVCTNIGEGHLYADDSLNPFVSEIRGMSGIESGIDMGYANAFMDGPDKLVSFNYDIVDTIPGAAAAATLVNVRKAPYVNSASMKQYTVNVDGTVEIETVMWTDALKVVERALKRGAEYMSVGELTVDEENEISALTAAYVDSDIDGRLLVERFGSVYLAAAGRPKKEGDLTKSLLTFPDFLTATP